MIKLRTLREIKLKCPCERTVIANCLINEIPQATEGISREVEVREKIQGQEPMLTVTTRWRRRASGLSFRISKRSAAPGIRFRLLTSRTEFPSFDQILKLIGP